MQTNKKEQTYKRISKPNDHKKILQTYVYTVFTMWKVQSYNIVF